MHAAWSRTVRQELPQLRVQLQHAPHVVKPAVPVAASALAAVTSSPDAAICAALAAVASSAGATHAATNAATHVATCLASLTPMAAANATN